MYTTPYLCEYCETTVSQKANLRRHLKNLHAKKTCTYTCMKCKKSYNRLDNIQRHTKSHEGMTETKGITTYTIRETSPDAYKPMDIQYKPTKCQEKPSYSSPENPNDYIYKQSLQSTQQPLKWWHQRIDIPLIIQTTSYQALLGLNF